MATRGSFAMMILAMVFSGLACATESEGEREPAELAPTAERAAEIKGPENGVLYTCTAACSSPYNGVPISCSSAGPCTQSYNWVQCDGWTQFCSTAPQSCSNPAAECSSASDCDGFCGGPGFGVCNGSTHCCICL